MLTITNSNETVAAGFPSRMEQSAPSKPSSQRQPPSRAQWPWALQSVSSVQVLLQLAPKKPMMQSHALALGKKRGEMRPVAVPVTAAGGVVVAERAAGGTGETVRTLAQTEVAASAGRA